MAVPLGRLRRWPGPVKRHVVHAGHPPSRWVVPGARVRRHRPADGQGHYLTESTSDEAKAQKILTRLVAVVDEQRSPQTKATLGSNPGCGRKRRRRRRSTATAATSTARSSRRSVRSRSRSRHRCWRSSTPTSAGVGTVAVACAGRRPSHDGRTRLPLRCATSGGPAGRGPSRTITRRPAASWSSARRTLARRWLRRSGSFIGF